MNKTWFDWEISIEDGFISIGIQHYPSFPKIPYFRIPNAMSKGLQKQGT